jgi:hypothetical protein
MATDELCAGRMGFLVLWRNPTVKEIDGGWEGFSRILLTDLLTAMEPNQEPSPVTPVATCVFPERN